jgi:hypothetical protein
MIAPVDSFSTINPVSNKLNTPNNLQTGFPGRNAGFGNRSLSVNPPARTGADNYLDAFKQSR